MVRWAFLLYGLGISGGANVIYNHALYACRQGVEITIISRDKKTHKDASWHIGTEIFKYETLESAKEKKYDVAIATEWRSAYDINQIDANKYVYFVQSIESRFFSNPNCLSAYIAEKTYEIPYKYITEVTWIKEYLKRNYNKEADLVLNGVDKSIFSFNGVYVENKPKNHVRFLIEGSVCNWLKNVPNTIRLCREAGAEEIWLVTPDNITSYEGVDRVFNQVPITKMSPIYRSCDVLVKLSLVEGMFGPPLEMFHCGGTAITYDIEGAEEYLDNGYNSLVVKKNDEENVKKAIKLLISDADYLMKLKKNAMKTAKKWCDWEQSSRQFYNSIQSLPCIKEAELQSIKRNGEAGASIYRRVEKYIGMCPGNNRVDILVNKYKEAKKKVYIYGAGSLCKNTIILLSEFDIPIEGIVVTTKEGNPNTVMGHFVYCIDDTSIEKESVLIYISTENYYTEIYKLLRNRGFADII